MKNKKMLKFISGRAARICLSLLLTLALTIGSLTGITAWAGETKTKEVQQKSIYVALGDSVPAGYGLTNADDCFVQQFSDQMSEDGYPNTLYNYAVSGTTTGDLLNFLQSLSSDNPNGLDTIRNASVITVNIGGNNVLGPLEKAVNEQLAQKMTELGLTDIAKATNTQLYSIGVALYNLTPDAEQMEQLKQGINSFSEDFPRIIKWLKANAPSANIIVSTIYNPIPKNLSFFETSETLLKQMNSVITDGSKDSDYYTADIYSTFMAQQAKGTQLLNLNLDQSKGPLSIDIHPNAAGHQLIADVHNTILQSLPCIVKSDINTPVTVRLSLPGKLDKAKKLSVAVTQEYIQSVIDKAQAEAKRSGRKKDGISIIIDQNTTKASSTAFTLDAAAINLLASKDIRKLTVATTALRFSLDKAALKTLAQKTAGKVTIKAAPVTGLSKAAKKLIGSRPVYQLSIEDTKGKKLSGLGKGKMELYLCYQKTANEKSSRLHLVSLNSKGQPKLLSGSSYSDGWVGSSGNTVLTSGVGYFTTTPRNLAKEAA